MLAHQAKDLRDLFTRLEKVRKEKEARRKRALEAESKKMASKLARKPEFKKKTSKFSKAKGKLALPARGEIVVNYGQKELKGLSSKGIKILTRNRAQVVSPYDGEVSFAGPFRGYGNLIIIEHGEGYHTLLAGLGNFDCEVGQELLAGEPVGQMPESYKPKLYVELRKNSHPINPIIWMKK
jgi:septal ring factor EnvC (AmiA/AmiB activator)